MTSSVIGSLRVNLGLDSAQFQRGLSRTNRDLNVARKRFLAFAGVAATVGTAMAGITVSASKTATEITRLAQVANTTPRSFQLWAVGAKTVGIEQEKLSDILKDVNDRVGDFLTTGGGPMADFFENVAPKVGITADAFRNLSGPQSLQLFISSLEKANLSQAEMTFYMEAMASDSTLLLPLLRDNATEMNRLAGSADALGSVMDDSTVVSLHRADMAMNEAKETMVALRNRIAGSLAPALEGAATGFVSLVEGVQGLELAKSNAARAIDNVTLAMGDEITQANALFTLMGTGTTMTQSAALATLSEAEAHLRAADAKREEANAVIALQMAEAQYDYRDQQAKLRNIRAGTDAYEEQEAVTVEILQHMQELRTIQSTLNSNYDEAAQTVARIREAIANAVDGMVTFDGEVITATDLTERLAVLTEGINFSEAEASAARLAAALGISVELAARMNALGQQQAPVGAGGGRGGDPREFGGDFLSWNTRDVDAWLARLNSGSGGGASRVKSTTDALRQQISVLEDAADPMREYTRGMAELDALKLAGLSDGAYALAVEGLAEELRAAQGATSAFTETFQEGFENALNYTLDGFKDGFSGLLDIVKNTIKQAIKFAISNPIKLALGIGGGGIAGATGGLGGDLFSGLMGSMGGSGGIMGALTGGGGLAAGFSGLAGGSGLMGGLGNTLAGTFGAGGGIGGLFRSIGGGAGLMSSIGAALPVIGIAAAAVSFFKTKTKLLDSGIRATIDMEGAMFESFEKIQKSKFWGLSKKTSYKYSALSEGESNPLNDAVRGVQDGVVSATEALGISSDVFDGFTHQFKVSLKGLDEAAKEAAIADALEGLGDRMAAQIDGLDEFTMMGEGAYTALTRLSTALVTVNDVFRDLGFNAYNVSLAGADAAAYFADLFGSLENFGTATTAYYDQFYTDEEKLANATARLTESLAGLGVDFVPNTNAAFREMVETAMQGGDTDLAASLIQLAPVFDSVTDAALALESAALEMRGAYQLDASGYATAFDAKIAYEAANQGKISQDLITAQNIELRRQSDLLEKMQKELVKQSNAAADSNFQSSLG
ncbi:hypothetical protein SAMN04488005_1504 [Yoonia tamlensis]|uniref:Phage tail tape measure protein, TP901 family, core region n=1 Tax=Yoonia tamlensis TaxID=390270 RepID=A0A1I6GE83_9RHOB|nr:hypothetical protein [Yoonia tamlensis]SFR40468.1 hypothetical protein SAMN04488005_1504 [Yoonia tamlensis]